MEDLYLLRSLEKEFEVRNSNNYQHLRHEKDMALLSSVRKNLILHFIEAGDTDNNNFNKHVKQYDSN
eukprot:Awhi_evm1s15681